MIQRAFWANIINKTLIEYLIIKFPITPTFYSLPKVHKNLYYSPERPVISGIQSFTLDVEALYLRFLHEKGLQVIFPFLRENRTIGYLMSLS